MKTKGLLDLNKSLYIALGYSCNHNCLYCPCHVDAKFSQNVTEEQIIEAIKSITTKTEIRSITLSGGEPTIQRNFYGVLGYLNTTDFQINILSNSESFFDEEKVKRLISCIDKNRVCVTTAIHHIDGSIHDFVTGVDGSFARSLQGLHNLRKNDVNVSVKCIVNKINYQVLPDYVDFVLSNFDGKVRLIFCGMDYCGNARLSAEKTLVSYKHITPYLENAIDTVEKHKNLIKVSIDELPLCLVDPYYWRYYSFNTNLGVSAHISPNKKESQINTIENMTSDCGKFYHKCRQCDAQNICVGTWKSAFELLGEDNVNPVNKIC